MRMKVRVLYISIRPWPGSYARSVLEKVKSPTKSCASIQVGSEINIHILRNKLVILKLKLLVAIASSRKITDLVVEADLKDEIRFSTSRP